MEKITKEQYAEAIREFNKTKPEEEVMVVPPEMWATMRQVAGVHADATTKIDSPTA